MSKVLVTGGAGFIGSHTVDRLVNNGYDVVVLDNFEKQAHPDIGDLYKNPKAKYRRLDVRSPKHWKSSLAGVEYVIHLAGAVGIAQSFWQVRKYVEVNSTGTANLYQTIMSEPNLRKNLKKIVVASSKSCYGEGTYECSEHGVIFPSVRPIEQLKQGIWEILCPKCGKECRPVPTSEDKPLQNLNPYSLSKYVTEQLALDFSYSLGIPTVALRYFNVYGSRQSLSNPYTGVIAIFMSRLRNGRSPVLFEDGKQLRDFIHVDDVARINVMALSKGQGAYNLGTGKPSSLLEIAEMLKNAIGSGQDPQVTGEFRPGDNRHDFSNNSKLERDFGISSFTSLDKGMKKLFNWAREASAVDKFDLQEKERRKYLTVR